MTADNLREPDKLAEFLTIDDKYIQLGEEASEGWASYAWEGVRLLRAALKEAQERANMEAMARVQDAHAYRSERETERTAAAARETALSRRCELAEHELMCNDDDCRHTIPDVSYRAREILALAEDGKKWRERCVDQDGDTCARRETLVIKAMDKANADNEVLRAMLREVEWSAKWGVCLFCSSMPHAPDCRLALLLKEKP